MKYRQVSSRARGSEDVHLMSILKELALYSLRWLQSPWGHQKAMLHLLTKSTRVHTKRLTDFFHNAGGTHDLVHETVGTLVSPPPGGDRKPVSASVGRGTRC